MTGHNAEAGGDLVRLSGAAQERVLSKLKGLLLGLAAG
jgi:hypothetical protein